MRPLALPLLALLLVPAASAQKSCLSGDCENGYGRAQYGSDPDSEIYEGPFTSGDPHGEGSLQKSDGWTYSGTFTYGVLDGVYLATHTNGQQERIRFQDGRFVEVVEPILGPGGVSIDGPRRRGLQAGSVVEGTITTKDPEVALTASGDLRHADAYTVLLRPGEGGTLRMESAAFDTYLLVERDGVFVERNDDFGGSRSVSQITLPAPTGDLNVTYTVYAGTFSETGMGTYTLSVTGDASGSTSADLTSSFRPVTYCALDGTALRAFDARYDADSGRYYTPEGRLVRDGITFEPWVTAMGRYAEGAPWYIDNEPIVVGGVAYVKYGLPRVLGVTEVEFLAEAGGATAFAEAGSTSTPDVIYVAVRPDCEFQPYQLDLTSRPSGVRDPEPAVLALNGGAASGTITASDPTVSLTASDDPRSADAYTLALTAGQRVTVRMESSAFDTYLKVVRDGQFVERNDDFEGSRSVSQLTFTAATSGTYTVYAGAFSEAANGAYTLHATGGDGTAAPSDETVVQGVLSDADRAVPLTASDDLRKADAHLVSVDAGRTLVVEMTSTAFDTYLRLERDGVRVAYNDDDGGTSRSSVRYTADRSGVVTVYAGTFTEAGRGAYALQYRVE